MSPKLYFMLGWTEIEGQEIAHFWFGAPGEVEAITVCGMVTHEKLNAIPKINKVCPACLLGAPYKPLLDFGG